MRRSLSAVLVLTAFVSIGRAEIIDRILAVVEGQLIMLSDVRGVIRLGLEKVPSGDDPILLVLDQLIDRQLMLVEVDRYAPPDPPSTTIDQRLEAIRNRFTDALAFETTLHQIGWARDDVRRYVRDTLRIETYLEQRFTATIQPSDDEIAAYYRLNAEAFTRGGVLAPYVEVRNDVRSRLVRERRATLVRDWLTGLRRRANFVQLYYTSATVPR